jgi:flagellar biosynthesis protein FliR
MTSINTAQFILLSLVFMRMSGFILLNPIFGRKNLPAIVKSGMIMVLTLLVYSFSKGKEFQINTPIEYAFLLLMEFAAGYVLGFVMQLFEFVITFAGGIMDYQMGLSMATIYDPQSNEQVPLSGKIFNIYYVLLFFAVDGHLALMKILITSAQVVPFGEIVFTSSMAWGMLEIFTQCVVMAVKFAFPIIAVEFLTEAGVGILMKMIPQINVFVINIQAKIFIGLLMLVFLFSPISNYLENLNATMIRTVQDALRLL